MQPVAPAPPDAASVALPEAKPAALDRERFYTEILSRGLYSNRRNLERFLASVFGSIPLAGRTVLDIGAGMGLLSFAAIQRGAARAVLIEPEAAGGTTGSMRRFHEARAALALDERVELHPVTFQAFVPGDQRFDVVVSHNSINHLDEGACAVLHQSPAARRTYAQIFRKLYDLTAPGAHVVLMDCARHNFFGDLGLRNPLMPAIEWHKHQQPRLWADLLADAGLATREIRWTTLHSLGRLGRLLCGNAVAAYLLTSHFRLVATKPHGPRR